MTEYFDTLDTILADVVMKKELNRKLKIIHKTCFTITNNLLLHREQNISTSLKKRYPCEYIFPFPLLELNDALPSFNLSGSWIRGGRRGPKIVF